MTKAEDEMRKRFTKLLAHIRCNDLTPEEKKEVKRKRDREYKKNHKKKLQEQKKTYYENNKESADKAAKAYREKNREEINRKQKIYYRKKKQEKLERECE